MKSLWRAVGLLGTVACLIWACGHDDALREYLSKQFWYPFRRGGEHFIKAGVQRISKPFAGMDAQTGPLARLRSHYQSVALSENMAIDPKSSAELLAAARASAGLSRRDREEIDLIDAKLDIRAALPQFRDPYRTAEAKLVAFLKSARTPEFLSEARGWLAHVYYELGDRTRAGKIYLDELNRADSNLSIQTLRQSLALTYGYDGRPELDKHLDEYFDTPEHAAFAITLVTNPRWNRRTRDDQLTDGAPPFDRIRTLLGKHASLFRSESGSATLAVLGMRTSLRAGDPSSALSIAANVPPKASVRKDPDFLWMLGSATFLSKDYKRAETSLLALYASPRATPPDRAAAAYGLCGVYAKLGNRVEQLRMALWLRGWSRQHHLEYLSYGSQITDRTVYWAISGWDLGMLLEMEASEDDLRQFLEKYGNVADVRLVHYALALRLARTDRYEEAAREFTAAGARTRTERMQKLASLWARITDSNDMSARVEMAEFLADNGTGVYFNSTLWSGFQNEALPTDRDTRLTRTERDRLRAEERRLRDEQEERWRGYLLTREVVRAEGRTELGRRAAQVALRCLRGINTGRFGRESEIAAADVELSRWLRGRG